MTHIEIVALVEGAFPYVPRPDLSEISFHGDDCPHCEMSRNFLGEFTEPELPPSAIRYLFDELTTLSPKAMAWVLPSYIRQTLTDPEHMDSATEYLIYNLGPSAEFEEETTVRLSSLDGKQIQCLKELIDYWKQSERWGEYCPEDLERARLFLQRQDA